MTYILSPTEALSVRSEYIKSMDKQELLGRLTAQKRKYRLCISGNGIFNPVYTFEEDELDIETIIGFTVVIQDKHNLVLSKIHAIYYSKGITQKITTIPILHFGDERKVEDLIIPQYTLKISGIDCIFKKEK